MNPWTQLLVLGCAQNCAEPLPAVIANITRLQELFEASEVLVLENDSTDATADQLRQWTRQSPGVHAFSLPGLQARLPQKTERLAHLRNGGLAWMRQRQRLHGQALLLVLDLDEVNAEPWDLHIVRRVLSWFAAQPQAAAVFANQQPLYYDLWALRHPSLCPDDLWEQQLELHLQQPQRSDAELLEAVLANRRLRFLPEAAPIPVESAFGGLGFYSGAWLQRLPQAAYAGSRCRWISSPQGPRLIRWHCAEHVAFHAHLRQAGAELWIHPALINGTVPELRLNPGAWRQMQG